MRALQIAVALVTLLLVAGSPDVASDTPVLHGTVVGVIDGDTADIRLESGMIRIRYDRLVARGTSPTIHGKPPLRGLRRSAGELARFQPLGLNATAISSGVNPADGRPGSVAWR
jgi:endonuclease YncB( thermonuclease family)